MKSLRLFDMSGSHYNWKYNNKSASLTFYSMQFYSLMTIKIGLGREMYLLSRSFISVHSHLLDY